MTTLITPRLILRPFQADDLDAFASICSDPEVMQYASFSGQPLTRSQAWNWLCAMEGHRKLRGYGMWAAVEKASGRLIGRIGLQYPLDYPGVEAAWMLSRDHWGQGLATEGGSAALDFGFRKLALKSIISLIFPENHRSIRLAERLGETPHGEVEIRGQRLLLYRIQREEWKERPTS